MLRDLVEAMVTGKESERYLMQDWRDESGRVGGGDVLNQEDT
jgi:hypothetical protein